MSSTKTPGRFLRTNYRLTGRKSDYEAVKSMLIHFRTTLQIDSAIGVAEGGIFTFSMNGYGIPSIVWIEHATHHDGFHSAGFQIGNISVSDSSIVYMSMGGGWSWSLDNPESGGSSIPITLMLNTISLPFYVVALIASR